MSAVESGDMETAQRMVDKNGSTQMLQFEGSHERVTKQGKSNHKVIDKLANTKDNISKLAVIHIDEIVQVSLKNNPYYTQNSNHQWLDENGWLHRNAKKDNVKKLFFCANVIRNTDGSIFNITLDITKTQNGRMILYATNGQIKRVGNVQLNSLKIKGSGLNSNSINSISKVSGNVNTKPSLAEMARNKDIRYSLSNEFSDLSTLDDEKIKVYNNRIWAYGLFTDEDILLLNERYNELQTNKRTDNVLGDGSRLV